MKFAYLVIAALLIASCAKEKDQDKKEAPVRSSVGAIHFDSSANAGERGALVNALEYMAENKLQDADPALLQILDLRSGDGPSLRAWLEERVQVVAGESFDFERFQMVDSNYRFENPDILPAAWRNRANQEKGTLIMANFGALAYLLGKETKNLVALNTATAAGQLRFTSPRTGLLVVGEGLLKAVKGRGVSTQRAFQLSTLLHEARHSDGNKLSAGFVHAKCPENHEFAGVNACDEAANGPYAVDMLATKSLLATCTDCSETDRTWLQGQIADSFSRILDKNLTWDPAPEGRRE